MNRNPMVLSLAMAALLGGGGFNSGGAYRPRDFTLDEVEEQSVQRMLRQARHRRRMSERQRQREEEAKAARIAAEKEAARPKSRQELRALARENAKDPRRWDRKRRP